MPLFIANLTYKIRRQSSPRWQNGTRVLAVAANTRAAATEKVRDWMADVASDPDLLNEEFSHGSMALACQIVFDDDVLISEDQGGILSLR